MQEIQDLVVIGAGPHALSFLCALLEPDPMDSTLVDAQGGVSRSRMSERSMRKRLVDRGKKPLKAPPGLEKLCVIDRFGSWMENWKRQFEFLGITHLRSTGGVHPDPVDPEIMFEFARWKGVSMEEGFEEIKDVPRNKYFRGPFQTPKTQLFGHYCEYLVDAYDLRNKVVKGEVTEVEPLSEACEGCYGKLFKIELACGSVVLSKRVVLSIGHCNQKRVPFWTEESNWDEHPQHQPVHVWDLVHSDAQSVSLAGKEVMVVGGGLTSVQLVEAGLRLGASHVHLLVRGDVKLRQFDSNLMWSGRLRHEKLSIFWAENSMTKRLETISDVRQGGTMPVEAKQRLEDLESSGLCSLREYTEVWEAKWSLEDRAFNILLSDDTQVTVKALWLATGSEVDIENEQILRKVLENKPVNVVSGYPCLQQDLRWTSGWDLYMIGAYAALQIGPDAVNLSGARRAGFCVANSIKNSLIS